MSTVPLVKQPALASVAWVALRISGKRIMYEYEAGAEGLVHLAQPHNPYRKTVAIVCTRSLVIDFEYRETQEAPTCMECLAWAEAFANEAATI